jgi:separase
MDITDLIPYFALHGCFKLIPKHSPFSSFFPDFRTPPEMQLVTTPDLVPKLDRCRQFRDAELFRDCANEGIEILKCFHHKTLKLLEHVALVQVYKWIIESLLGSGRPDAAFFYGQQMRTIFTKFPFIVGFAAILELKARAQLFNVMGFVAPPMLEFKAPINWNCVVALANALVCLMNDEEDCFRHFQFTLESGNVVAQRMALPYYAVACRSFGLHPDLHSYEAICKSSRESRAEYLYHVAVELIRMERVEDHWSYTNPEPPSSELIGILGEAEELAKAYVFLRRKIQQLRALATGTSDQVQTANLIAVSVSRSLDQYLEQSRQTRFSIPFPLLAVIHIDVSGLDRCLLLASFHPSSRPFVARIVTRNRFEAIVDALEEIQDRSNAVSGDLAKKEWWTIKLGLDRDLMTILKQFEEILGIWKGVLAPRAFQPPQNSLFSALYMTLHSNIELKEEIEATVGMSVTKFPRISDKLPLGLILGKGVHKIPWESLPFAIESQTAITRIPSMRLVALQAMKQLPVDIDPALTFFVLNPKGDLNETESIFRPIFSSLRWEGLVRRSPDASIIERALQHHDLFIYCGHGSGNEYYDYTAMMIERRECRASMLLMGCSSGKLSEDGDMEPFGVPYSCVSAGSGAVVANLWNVTDRDIDRFLEDLLQNSILRGPCDLAEAVARARQACKLKYLTGAAPVVYGFLTLIQHRED